MSLSNTQSYTLSTSAGQHATEHFELKINAYEKECSLNLPTQSDHYTIILVSSGKGTYSIDFNEFEVNGAGLFCISPGQVISVHHESILEAYQIHFNRDFYCIETHGKEIACNGKLFNNVHKATFIPLVESGVGPFKSIIDSLIREMKNPGMAHRDILETYLRMLLIEALRHSPSDTPESFDPKKSGTTADFIALVDRHFRSKHTVQEYADLLFITPRSLAKRLKADGYGTPLDLIKERIVLEAKRALRYSEQPVKEISYDLGFDDPGYFTRYFKKAQGVSPATYRQQYTQ